MELVTKAIIFASNAHDGMRRKKCEVPYIMHPLEAAVIVSTMTSDQEVIAASILHDVVEDAGITLDQVEKEFGLRVRNLVASETENKREEIPPHLTWKIRKVESLEILQKTEDIDVLKMWIGDKLSNMRAVYEEWKIIGDKIWDKFSQKDPNEQGWYYKEIAKHTRKLSNYQAWQEYNELVNKVFK